MVKSIKGSYKIQYHPNPEQEPDNVRSFFTRFFNSVFFTVNFLHGIFNCGFVVLAVLKIMPIIDVGHQKVDHSTFIYHFIFDLFKKIIIFPALTLCIYYFCLQPLLRWWILILPRPGPGTPWLRPLKRGLARRSPQVPYIIFLCL
jgi:hypothetical protein